jgi:hypothetical protein
MCLANSMLNVTTRSAVADRAAAAWIPVKIGPAGSL